MIVRVEQNTGGKNMADEAERCSCGNVAEPGEKLCEHCAWVENQPPHTGHWSTFGTYWCDTCDSPYCELA